MSKQWFNLAVVASIVGLLLCAPVAKSLYADAVVAASDAVPVCEIVDAVIAGKSANGFNKLVVASDLLADTEYHDGGLDAYRLTDLQRRSLVKAATFDPSSCGFSSGHVIDARTQQTLRPVHKDDPSDMGANYDTEAYGLEFGRMIWETQG